MHSDDEFEKRIRRELDNSVDELDEHIQQRLRQARRQAVEKAARQGRTAAWWKPVAGFALAASLVLAVIIWPGGSTDLPVSNPVDLELMAADDSLQLYEELDFYEWLAETENSAG